MKRNILADCNGIHLFFILSKQKTRIKKKVSPWFYLIVFPYVDAWFFCDWNHCSLAKPGGAWGPAVFLLILFWGPFYPGRDILNMWKTTASGRSVTTVKNSTQSDRSQELNFLTRFINYKKRWLQAWLDLGIQMMSSGLGLVWSLALPPSM